MPFSIHPYRRFPMQCAVTYHAGDFLKLSVASFLGFWLLITLLLLSSSPADAEWVSITKTEEGTTVYADPNTIRRNGNLVKMCDLYDFETVQTVAGKSYLSSKSQNEYDCTEERFRVIMYSNFSGNMGASKLVYYDSDEQKWMPVPPGSVVQHLWAVACAKK